MEYCRSLKFEQAPDYDVAIGFFQSCMKRHNLDPTVFDYTWKQMKLDKEKENLKKGLTSLISKTPRESTKKVLEVANAENQ